VNQSDGRIYYRNGSGTVTQFSSIASYATAASFPASGASTSVLHLATDSSRLYQWTGTVYVEIGVASGYTLPNATSSTLGGVVVGTGLSVSSGTVSANVVSVAGRTGTVSISSSDVSGLGSLATQNSVAYSSLTGTPSSFIPSSHASSHASGGSDPISLSASQVSGLASVATSGSYTDLSSKPTIPTAGTGSTNYCSGNDSRLSDARSPTSHQHAASDINSGTISTARLASGTADSTTYLRGDQTWAAVSVSIADGSITSAKLADPFTYDCGAYSAIAPAAPTGISGTPGVGNVALSWTAPTNTGGVSLTDYIVQHSTDQSSWTTFADGTSTATTATVTGLTGGTSYYFRVAAVNSAGTGSYVTSSAVTPSASKLTIARSNGTSTFTGAGTAASPFSRATRVKNNAADTVMANGYYLAGTGYTGGYTWTASASGTVYVTFTFYDDNLDGATGWPRKNGTKQGTDVGDGQTLTARAISVVSGDVITLFSDSILASFSNVSVWAV
jgi:hypothetical protein